MTSFHTPPTAAPPLSIFPSSPPPAVMLPCAVIEQLQRARQARRGEQAESSKRQPPSPPPLTPRPLTHKHNLPCPCTTRSSSPSPSLPPLHVKSHKSEWRRGMVSLLHLHIQFCFLNIAWTFWKCQSEHLHCYRCYNAIYLIIFNSAVLWHRLAATHTGK